MVKMNLRQNNGIQRLSENAQTSERPAVSDFLLCKGVIKMKTK